MASYPANGSLFWDASLRSYLNELKGVWDIRDNGAVADGTTDNATAINAAITACNTAGGGAVLIPSAALAWATGSTIVMKANVTLLLYGTVKALAAHAGAGITATDVSNIEIAGPGTVDMNKAATTNGGNLNTQQGVLIWTQSAVAVTKVRIRDITVTNCWHYGVTTSGGFVGSSLSDVVIDHVTVTSAGQDGINIAALGVAAGTPSTSAGYSVSRCRVINPSVNGIQLAGVSDAHVDKNLVTATSSTGHGIFMGAGAGVTTDHCTDFTVTGNRVRGFTGTSVWGIGVSARCNRFNVSGNDVRGCSGGITIDVTDPNAPTVIQETDGTVSDNSCALSTAAAQHGINVNFAKGLTVTGNVCRGGTGYGIAVSSSSGVTVTGNICRDNAQIGLALFGTTAGMGGHTVTGNTVTGNSVTNYYNETPVVSTLDLSAVTPSTLVAQQSLSNSVAESTQFTYTIPTHRDQAGTTYRITLGYVIDNIATSGTLTLRLYGWGGGVLLASVVLPSQVGAATNQPAYLDYLLTVRTAAASGRVMVMGNIRSEFSSVSKAFGGIVSSAVDTTIGASLLVTAQWGTANAGNVCRLELAAVDVVKT